MNTKLKLSLISRKTNGYWAVPGYPGI